MSVCLLPLPSWRHPSQDRLCRLAELTQEMVRVGLLAQRSTLSPGLFWGHPGPGESSWAAEAGWPSGLKGQNIQNNNSDFPGGPVVNSVLPLQGGMVSIPGWGAKIPYTAQYGQKNKRIFFSLMF